MKTLSKVRIMQSWKDLTVTVSEKRPTLRIFFSIREICQLSPLNTCESFDVCLVCCCYFKAVQS